MDRETVGARIAASLAGSNENRKDPVYLSAEGTDAPAGVGNQSMAVPATMTRDPHG